MKQVRTRVVAMCAVATLALVAAGSAEASDGDAGEAMPADRVTVGQEAPAVELGASDETTHSLAARQGVGSTVMVFYRGVW